MRQSLFKGLSWISLAAQDDYIRKSRVKDLNLAGILIINIG
jgi:hypothetical protein